MNKIVSSSHNPSKYQTVLIRLASEINTKSPQVRQDFITQLQRNIRAAFAGLEAKLSYRSRRLWLELPIGTKLEPLGQVFGVQSYSPVDADCSPTMEAILACAERYRELVAGRTFAVRCRRGDVAEPRSVDVERAVGSLLYECSAGVSLDAPEVEIGIDVRRHGCFFFVERIAGPGGLPLGVQGRALALFSGGFDSPVAAYELMRRGVKLDFLIADIAGRVHQDATLDVLRALVTRYCHGYSPRLYLLPMQGTIEFLIKSVPGSYLQLVFKSLLYQVGERIAADIGAHALLTGECVGQVGSQTLASLAALDRQIQMPVLRPLVARDKEEIIACARRIGTHASSEKIREFCRLTKSKPVTNTTAEKLARVLDELPAGLVDDLCASVEESDVPQPCEDAATYITQELPAGAQIIDCRPSAQYRDWHWPQARNIPIQRLEQEFKGLNPRQPYVLLCAYGMESTFLAERMQRAGYDALSYVGGVQRLRQNSP